MNNTSKTLSVIVPVYFNAESLMELFERFQEVEAELAKKSAKLELIFVDDGSKDNSFDVLLAIKKIRPETKLVKLTKNFGSMACITTGFNYVTGDCFAVITADLQDPPEQLLPMYDLWEQGNKVILCNRISRKDPITSKIFSAIYYKVLDILVVKGGADIILADKALLGYVLNLGRNVNYLLYIFWLGFEPKLIGYHRQERKYGKSRWTFKKKFLFFLDTINGFSVAPIRLISVAGLAISLLSMLYGFFLVVRSITHGVEVPGFITLVVLISFSTSIIIAILAMIGEYIWRIFEIVSRHPKSVVDLTYLEPSND
jgi:dolichol-phosphate mannosyltransferase